jgi:hypothetical protein
MKKELSIKTRPLTTKEIVKFIKEELSDQFIEELILRELNFNNIYFEYTYLKLKDYYESMLPDVNVFCQQSETYATNHAIRFRYKAQDIEQSELDRMIKLRAFI